MLKAFKVEIHPTAQQAQKIIQFIGVCRFLFNQYVAKNLELLRLGKRIMSAFAFDKYVNHELSVEFPWIKNCGSKARKKSLVNGETAFARYSKGNSGRPTFKKRNQQDVQLYFPKNNKGDLKIERHRINVPTLGWVRTKENGYIPVCGSVSSCTVEFKAGRFYVSALFKEVPLKRKHKIVCDQLPTEGIGIDLGLKEFATLSTGSDFGNINKTSVIKKIEKCLRREQRSLSRKYEAKKERDKGNDNKNETKSRNNIEKNVLRVQKIHAKLAQIREAYRAWIVSVVVKTKPQFITLEKLNVKGMKKNRHLAKSYFKSGILSVQVKIARSMYEVWN